MQSGRYPSKTMKTRPQTGILKPQYQKGMVRPQTGITRP
jgi:hypothetical protein